MLKTLRQFFEIRVEPLFKESASTGDTQRALRLATIALFVEISRADHKITDDERCIIITAAAKLFKISEADSAELMSLAEHDVNNAVGFFQFTRLVDSHFPMEDKKTIVKLLWKIAFADEQKDKYEEYTVRQISDLLHVSHQDFIYAKHQAESER